MFHFGRGSLAKVGNVTYRLSEFMHNLHNLIVNPRANFSENIAKLNDAVRFDNFFGHSTKTKLVCVEDLLMDGSFMPLNFIAALRDYCKLHGFAIHLDGMSAFNALHLNGASVSE